MPHRSLNSLPIVGGWIDLFVRWLGAGPLGRPLAGGTSHGRSRRPLQGALCLLLTGCVGGPSYAGGPTTEEPHGVVDPGYDVSLWRVDGHDTVSRGGETYLAPGRRRLLVRIQHDIESDDWAPKEMRIVPIDVEENTLYTIDRKPGEFPPWEIDIRKYPLE